MPEPIRVLLVDDQRLMRDGLRTLLELEPDLSVVGEVSNGQEAVQMGLANICVPHEKLDETVQEWAETICERSPTAIQ